MLDLDLSTGSSSSGDFPFHCFILNSKQKKNSKEMCMCMNE